MWVSQYWIELSLVSFTFAVYGHEMIHKFIKHRKSVGWVGSVNDMKERLLTIIWNKIKYAILKHDFKYQRF
jgi:hypothetical protein